MWIEYLCGVLRCVIILLPFAEESFGLDSFHSIGLDFISFHWICCFA